MLFAVHISDGVLLFSWQIIGIVAAMLLVLAALLRFDDDDIPRVGMLTAAFFVASLIHVKIGPTSVHLLLNSLVGIVLGRRAPIAIAIGLVLQAFLLAHGGFLSLGINCLIMAIPSLLTGGFFRCFSQGLRRQSGNWLAVIAGVIGSLCVLLTCLFNSLVLSFGGIEDWRILAGTIFVAHLPIVAIEAVVCGCTVRFLAKVKPALVWGSPRDGALGSRVESERQSNNIIN